MRRDFDKSHMSKQNKQRNKFIGIALVIGLVFLGYKALSRASQPIDSSLAGRTAVVYRSPTCGCCANYVAYLRKYGVDVDERQTNDMDAIKKQYGVPAAETSCHTTIIDGYVVEGHIPAEGIEKLLADKPGVKGIAMGGMPAGSPGMPGAKNEQFEIFSFTGESSTSPYLSL